MDAGTALEEDLLADHASLIMHAMLPAQLCMQGIQLNCLDCQGFLHFAIPTHAIPDVSESKHPHEVSEVGELKDCKYEGLIYDREQSEDCCKHSRTYCLPV